MPEQIKVSFNQIMFFCAQGFYIADKSSDEKILRAGQLASALLNKPLTIYTAMPENIVDGIYSQATLTKGKQADIVISNLLEDSQDIDDESVLAAILSEYYAKTSKVYYVFALLLATAAFLALLFFGIASLFKVIETTQPMRLVFLLSAAALTLLFYFIFGNFIVDCWTLKADKAAIQKSGVDSVKLALVLLKGLFSTQRFGIPSLNIKLKDKNLTKRIDALNKMSQNNVSRETITAGNS